MVPAIGQVQARARRRGILRAMPTHDGDPSPRQQRLRAAIEAWPGVTIDASEVSAAIEDRGHLGPEGDWSLEQSRLEDLVLAVAALAGDAAGLVALHRLSTQALDVCARRMSLTDADAAEIGQRLRTRLLVGPEGGGARALTSYGGRGPLRAWLQVCATREALMLIRERRGQPDLTLASDSGVPEAIESRVDPELALLRDESRSTLKQALHAAFASLPASDRLLLAYHYVDGRTHREIGSILGANASTICRRLLKIRQQLLAAARGELVARVGDEASLQGLVDVARSQLDLSISRILRDTPR